MKQTVMQALDARAKEHGQLPALKYKDGSQWQTLTWSEYRDQVRQTARAFMALGLEAGEGVAIIGSNRTQWFVADLAAIHAGGHPAGIYATNTPEQCLYITEHSDATIAVVEDADQLAKFKAVRSRLPRLKAIVMMLGDDEDEDIHPWDALPGLAEKVSEEGLEARITPQQPDDLCTLIYTSGTTADPKGVMLSHDNCIWTGAVAGEMTNATPSDRLLTYLPLSHVAEQIMCMHMPLVTGTSVWCCESLDWVAERLGEVHPTLFLSVPRLWEKIQAKMMAAGAQNSPLKKKIAAWARGVGLAGGYAEDQGRSKPLLYPLANKLVFSKVREKLGLDQCRMAASGTAPLNRDTLEFFLSLGIPLLGVYGLSETSAPAAMGVDGSSRLGTVGRAITGSEIRIANDGEIMIKGRHVFIGYYKNDEATQEVLEKDGWFHSGDVGELDADGFLSITDRKKEIIITAGGENIAPALIEARLKGIAAVGQAVAIGDRRKYLSALISLDPENLDAALTAAGSPEKDLAGAARCEHFRGYLQAQIDEVNRQLARVQTVKKFTILPHELSLEGGELTPTLKLKRRVVNDKYAELIESMYVEAAAGDAGAGAGAAAPA